jgi:MerR family redox-sensitive transcriptional activator SoxR
MELRRMAKSGSELLTCHIQPKAGFKSARNNDVKIGELSLQSGVPASTIRYYERIGILPRAVRVGGQRRYASDAIDRLAVVKLAQYCGFSLGEMRQLLYGFRAAVPPSQRWQQLARKKEAELDVEISRISEMKSMLGRVAGCQCPNLAECGRRAAGVLFSTSIPSRRASKKTASGVTAR